MTSSSLPRAAMPEIDRYAAKATELGVAPRTIRRWAAAYQQRGVAGLASARVRYPRQVDPRWSEAALAIMREHTQESKPSEKAVIYQTSKRLEICFGHGVVPEPSQATATGSSNGSRFSTPPSQAPLPVTGISPRDPNGPTGSCSRPGRGST